MPVQLGAAMELRSAMTELDNVIGTVVAERSSMAGSFHLGTKGVARSSQGDVVSIQADP